MGFEITTIPFEQACVAADEAVTSGLVKKITVVANRDDELSIFDNGIQICCDPPNVGEYLAFKMKEALGIHVEAIDKVPPISSLHPKAGGAKPILSWPHDSSWTRMVDGHPFIPTILGWERRHIRYEGKIAPKTLVIRRANGRTSVGTIGFLRFRKDTGIEIAPAPDASYNKPSLSDLTDKKNLLSWLQGFLPSKDILQGMMYRLDIKDAPDTDSEEGLFWFFSRFGTMLVGDIDFRKPLANNSWPPQVHRVNPRISRAMPKFSHSLGFPFHLFPGQSMGFPLDIDRGIWDADALSGYYYLPEKSYGAQAINERVNSIEFARVMGIPTVEYAMVNVEKLKGLALKRFDIHCGRILWRQNKSQLGENWVEILNKKLSQEDRKILVTRMVLGVFFSFDGTDFVLYELSPEVYVANGPDGEKLDIAFDNEKLEKKYHPIRLAPFTGAKKRPEFHCAFPDLPKKQEEIIAMAERLGVERAFVDELFIKGRKFVGFPLPD